MSTGKIVAVLVIAAVGSPVLADIPDGHGGRTSPQATPRAAVERLAHGCCPRHVVAAPAPPASPAEVKAIGEIAYTSRYGVRTTETIACYKMAGPPAQTYASSAERKALGHTTRASVASKRDSQCCGSAVCPMRRAS